MKTLVFDTCLDKMYVALSDGDKILESIIVETTEENYHSAYLLSSVANILKSNSLKPSDVELLATNIGPGSFTGIRACTTVARVFAQGSENLKAVGVSSLEIISRINKTNKPTLVALDARKNMVYAAIYHNKVELMSPKTILCEELKEIISNNDYYVITDNKMLPEFGGISYQSQTDNLGEYLLKIANEKFALGCETDWQKLLPLYIQPPPVTVKKNV